MVSQFHERPSKLLKAQIQEILQLSYIIINQFVPHIAKHDSSVRLDCEIQLDRSEFLARDEAFSAILTFLKSLVEIDPGKDLLLHDQIC